MENITKELVDGLIAAQAEIQHATKDGKNPYFTSEYATLEQVISTVKPTLTKHGLMFQQISHERDGGACVETLLLGHGGVLGTGPVFIAASKKDAQAFGSAMTYAKRYSLSLACGIGHQKDDGKPVMQDDDGEANRKQESTFKLVKSNAVIDGCDNPIQFLEKCRQYLPDPESQQCKAIFDDSKEYIKKAQDASKGKIHDAFVTLMELYTND